MRACSMVALALLGLFMVPPAAASEFAVVSATGVVEPEGLEAELELELEKTPRLRLEPWGRAVLREKTGCGLTHVIAGVGEHQLTPADDCSALAAPGEVAALVQQGAAFAALLKETGSGEADLLVQMLVNEPCVFMPRVSEEGGNARHCPSGYALRGLRCSGSFCDNKDLLCCPYLDGLPDPTAKELASRLISDEIPNVVLSKRFLNGLACDGAYCDNVFPYQFKSSRLVNSRDCEWSPWASERPNAWLDCGAGRLMSGLRCKGDYCGDVGVYCCKAQVE